MIRDVGKNVRLQLIAAVCLEGDITIICILNGMIAC